MDKNIFNNMKIYNKSLKEAVDICVDECVDVCVGAIKDDFIKYMDRENFPVEDLRGVQLGSRRGRHVLDGHVGCDADIRSWTPSSWIVTVKFYDKFYTEYINYYKYYFYNNGSRDEMMRKLRIGFIEWIDLNRNKFNRFVASVIHKNIYDYELVEAGDGYKLKEIENCNNEQARLAEDKNG